MGNFHEYPALAVQVMQLKGLAEIHSFDKTFEKIGGITRLQVA